MFDIEEGGESQPDRILNLNNLSLSLLPDFGGLSHLLLRITNLNLSNNNLTSLGGISILGHLRVLNVSENKISALSIDELSALKQLTTLNLHDNDISEVNTHTHTHSLSLSLSFSLVLFALFSHHFRSSLLISGDVSHCKTSICQQIKSPSSPIASDNFQVCDVWIILHISLIDFSSL